MVIDSRMCSIISLSHYLNRRTCNARVLLAAYHVLRYNGTALIPSDSPLRYPTFFPPCKHLAAFTPPLAPALGGVRLVARPCPTIGQAQRAGRRRLPPPPQSPRAPACTCSPCRAAAGRRSSRPDQRHTKHTVGARDSDRDTKA